MNRGEGKVGGDTNPVAALLESPLFEDIDRGFALFLARRCGCADAALLAAAALASAATREGHVCLDLADWAGKAIPAETGDVSPFDPEGVAGEGLLFLCPSLPEWTKALRGWSAVGDGAAEPPPFTPLVLDGAGRLYLHRYWTHERTLATLLLQRGGRPAGERGAPPAGGVVDAESGPGAGTTAGDGSAGGSGVDAAAAGRTALLDRLFPPPAGGEADLQRTAAERAMTGALTLVSGGPGTGKTSTVAKILALLHYAKGSRGEDVALCAPTGKAAARLSESIEQARGGLPIPEEAQRAISSNVSTIHRLLGARLGSVEFRRGESDPLPHDVVIVDEASMIALPLMVRLLQALRPGARLVLLGDRDQLVSVEPGKVFGDLCRAPAGSALSRCVVTLSKSFRFVEGSGIGEASRLVNAGRSEEALAVMEGERHGDIAFRESRNDAPTRRALEEVLLAAYEPVVTAPTVEEALAAFRRFRVLCAVRRGPFGVEEVNRTVERALERKGLIRRRGGLYRGRPVMVVRNDYRQGLYNGDVGILFPGSGGGALRAFFPGEEGGALRELLPGRLPVHETAWAMTVHKSQGSEFDRVLLLLGDSPSAVHTRELVYTGLTRAKARVEMWSTRALFARAVGNPVKRRSGLWERLAGVP